MSKALYIGHGRETTAVPLPTATTATSQQLSIPLWEKSYYDRILRGRGQLQHMINYVHDNPRRLWIKHRLRNLFCIST